jgi:MarR family transcriptional regulator, negative regulator of the multidrug operon emrRAB
MRGIERLSSVERSTPAMADALPDLPMGETVMVRLIRICVVGMGQYFEPVFRSIGLTENSFHVLCLLMASSAGRASPSELSDMVGTSRSNMTKILESLAEDGFVSRSTDEKDSRRLTVQITPAGIRAANRATPKLAGPLREAFSGLSAREFAQLDALLRKAIVSFDKNAVSFPAKTLAGAGT